MFPEDLVETRLKLLSVYSTSTSSCSMELKIIALVVCLGALLCTASCQDNGFDPSLYANQISKLISDVNKDIKVSRVTLRQLHRAVSKYGDAFETTAKKVKEFEKALKNIVSNIRDNVSKLARLQQLEKK